MEENHKAVEEYCFDLLGWRVSLARCKQQADPFCLLSLHFDLNDVSPKLG
jgi:hypothetical protein